MKISCGKIGLISLALTMLILCLKTAGAKKGSREDLGKYSGPRVEAARKSQTQEIIKLFEKAGLTRPSDKIFIRVFKLERSVELWAFHPEGGKYKLIQEYHACALSGNLGPKRKQGDHQVPEGFYNITDLNPASRFHLSARVNYPNQSDLILGNKLLPGGDIFIHGSCVSDGCVSIRDQPIEQVYLIILDAKAAGQKNIPVHIFPCRMDKSYCESTLGFFSMDKEGLKTFWDSLKPGYDYFEANQTVPEIKTNPDGSYQIKQ